MGLSVATQLGRIRYILTSGLGASKKRSKESFTSAKASPDKSGAVTRANPGPCQLTVEWFWVYRQCLKGRPPAVTDLHAEITRCPWNGSPRYRMFVPLS